MLASFLCQLQDLAVSHDGVSGALKDRMGPRVSDSVIQRYAACESRLNVLSSATLRWFLAAMGVALPHKLQLCPDRSSTFDSILRKYKLQATHMH